MNIAEADKEYKPFRKQIFKKALTGFAKGLIFASTLFYLDRFLLKISDIPTVERDIFVNVVIGGIGVAGVILGLYYANIVSIYSTKYASAPKRIANAFQQDRLTRKCTSAIIDYFIFCFIVIIGVLLRLDTSWLTFLTIVLWSAYAILSYSIAGNRAYQLSDIYSVADDSFRILYRVISKNLCQNFFSTDAGFQNHFLKVAEKQLRLLQAIQEYGASITNGENSAVVKFMCNNLALINAYWRIKKSIGRTSLWFRNETKYQKWHLTDNSEALISLRTGTPLRVRGEPNYWWFEDELMSINRSCLISLLEQRDYTSLYTYVVDLEKVSKTAISCKEASYYISHVDWLKNLVEKHVVSEEDEAEVKKSFTGVVEVVSLLYLGLIVESREFYNNFNINKIVSAVINSLDTGMDIEKLSTIRGREDVDFYRKILTEVRVEGKRITPDWLIRQYVAKEEYVYLNSLLDIVREGINHAFNLGKFFAEQKLFFEACIILTRFYEYESKLTRFMERALYCENELRNIQVDKNLEWDGFRLEKLKDTITNWRNSIPTLLLESTCEFALKNWENREEYPDFLGECYNRICEDAIEAIINNDIKQFSTDYENLSKLMLLYQEYIRSDFIENKDLYRVEYAFYTFTSPIAEWAQIGGLAILWGEFNTCRDWFQIVKNGADWILKRDDQSTNLPEKLINYLQHRDKFIFGIGNRDMLKMEWKQRVAHAIRKSEMIQIERVMYGAKLKTDSKLLQAFCSDFVDRGFAMNDPSEVFLVLCVNPLIPKEKQYHTKYSWENKLNE